MQQNRRLHEEAILVELVVLVEKRVAIAIFILKFGADYALVGVIFGVGKSTVFEIVQNCQVRSKGKRHIGMRTSGNSLCCLCAIDVNHKQIMKPNVGDQDYFNYKDAATRQYCWNIVV